IGERIIDDAQLLFLVIDIREERAVRLKDRDMLIELLREIPRHVRRTVERNPAVGGEVDVFLLEIELVNEILPAPLKSHLPPFPLRALRDRLLDGLLEIRRALAVHVEITADDLA